MSAPVEQAQAPPGSSENIAQERNPVLEDFGGLKAERARGVYRLRFSESVEKAYRKSARRQRRVPRVVLFIVFGACFLFGPLYDVSLLRIAPDLHHLMRLIELVLVPPVTFAAAAATYFNYRAEITYALQTAAVLTTWGSVILLRRLGLEMGLHFPSFMIGYVVVAVAIFSGFNWYRIAFGTSIVLTLAGLQEAQLDQTGADAWLQICGLVLVALISILGAYVIETSQRLAWINGRSAALLAKTDVLTGLANRSEFNRLIPIIFAQARRERRLVAMALIDIDHFKLINDRYGHLFGDAVLRAVGKVLSSGSGRRPLDVTVRYGGEEMVVVWYGLKDSALPALAEELLGAIRAIRITPPDSETPLDITASIGVSWLVPDGRITPEEVLRHADVLMYRAKADGRNRIRMEPHPSAKPRA